MDIQKVNTVLNRAIRILEDAEMEGLQESLAESYVGYGGTEPPDHSPTGNPETGAAGGVDNEETSEEQFYSYLMQVTQTCAEKFGIPEEDVVNYMEDFAEQLAQSGEIPPMPDPETGTAEEFSTWAGAAKTCGFEGRLCDYVGAMVDGESA